MIKIVDIGSNFGMDTYHIFKPWDTQEIRIKDLARAEPLVEVADLICFGGGGDIHPSIYGHANVGSNVGPVPTYRDNFEVAIWNLARKHNKPVLGICRGAQLACALSGGWLIQNVQGHVVGGSGHEIKTIDGTTLLMSSLHHQMMYPYDIDHELIAWADVRTTCWEYDDETARAGKMDKDPEVVYFPRTRSLGIQGHPEFYDDPMAPPVVYTRELVQKYLNVGV